MLKLAGEMLAGQLADHTANLDAHTRDIFEVARTGEYTPSPLIIGAMTSSSSIAANKLYAIPYPITRARTPATMFIEVGGADVTNPNLRLGLYADTGSVYPGTRLTNGGVVDVSTTGVKTVAYTTQLTKGLYWLVFIADGTPGIYYIIYENIRLFSRTDIPRYPSGSFNKAGAYGDLPTTFTSGANRAYQLYCVGFDFSSND